MEFEILKKKAIEQLVLELLYISKVFQVDCDASNLVIGVVLSQDGRPVALFSEKLNEAKNKYSVYDLEFYAIIQALKKR
jgi:hypothetical protein